MYASVQMQFADPLSEILSLLKPRTYVSAGLDAGGNWAIRFPEHQGIKFNAVIRGTCWVSIQGVRGVVRLSEGDSFLLTTGKPFMLASDLELPSIESWEIYDRAQDGVARCNGGGDFFLIGGRFGFAGHADVLLRNLPPIVHIHGSSDQASVLRWGLERFALEVRDRQPGGVLVTEHLAHMMLVQVLRIYLQSEHAANSGWLSALSDRRIGTVIGAMHGDLARNWTLQELAKTAGMSRSAFAAKFKQLVGLTPLAYLTRWKMLVAADRLNNRNETVAEIADTLGYDSETAFRTAFKRVMSLSPKQYRSQAV